MSASGGAGVVLSSSSLISHTTVSISTWGEGRWEREGGERWERGRGREGGRENDRRKRGKERGTKDRGTERVQVH